MAAPSANDIGQAMANQQADQQALQGGVSQADILRLRGQQAQQAQQARASAPSVGAGLPSLAAPTGQSTNSNSGYIKGGDVGPNYNPAQGQLHTGVGTTPSTSVVNPVTGGYMATAYRDKAGNLVMRPGEQGFQTSQQRVNLDPYAQQLAQTGNMQMQRGLSGATLANMPQVQAGQMQAAQIDKSGFNQQAGAQQALANQGNMAITQLQGAANGMAPSAAMIQQQAGLDQAQQQAMAMAASARGGADQRAAAMRQGQMAGANIAMQGVNQAASLRAQEQAQARGQLMGAIGQQQGLAQQQGLNQLGASQAQAQLQQQAGLANQGSNLQASMANQQGYLAGTGMDTSMVGQGAGLYSSGANMGLQGVDYNNQANQTDFNQQMAMQAAANGVYGTQVQSDSARYAANQAANAATTGALINAGGQVLGASMQAFAPQQQPRKY